MKAFFAILAFVALINAEWVPKTELERSDILKQCHKDHPLSEEAKNKVEQLENFDEEGLRQYLLCLFQNFGVFTADGGYHTDRLAKHYQIDESEFLSVGECFDKNEQGSPLDVWAYRGHACLFDSKIGEKIKAYIRSVKRHHAN